MISRYHKQRIFVFTSSFLFGEISILKQMYGSVYFALIQEVRQGRNSV